MSIKLEQLGVSTDLNGRMLSAAPSFDDLDFSVVSEAIHRSIAKVAFDKKRGSLVIIRVDGKVIEVSGFPTQAAFGEGKMGSRGLRGNVGRDGRDGRDADEGTQGCPGVIGNRGLDGLIGNAGEDGPRGIEGEPGYPGNRGTRGDEGPVGPTGSDGPEGNPGTSCVAGAPGPTGPSPNINTITSTTEPTDPLVFGWLFPTSKQDPNPIPLPTTPDITASVPSVQLIATRASGVNSNIWVGDTYLTSNTRNGVGPFSYKWSLTKMNSVVLSDDTNPRAYIKFSKAIGAGVEWMEKGRITLTVTDEGKSHRPKATAHATLKITATNPDSLDARGCIVFGSKIRTPAGFMDVEHIREGMLVTSASGQPKNFRNWSSKSMAAAETTAVVTAVRFAEESGYYRINGQSFTFEHPILVLDSDTWKYIPAQMVNKNHQLLGLNGPVSVYETVKVDALVRTVDIDVDPYDCYFIGNILVHNTDAISREEKTYGHTKDSN